MVPSKIRIASVKYTYKHFREQFSNRRNFSKYSERRKLFKVFKASKIFKEFEASKEIHSSDYFRGIPKVSNIENVEILQAIHRAEK